ncbi:unnamed protein product [Nezara viridula]|uniref:Protein ELYS n=1 Tax=Nezara viridula TaxID=85310 RepID=A0A9P0EA50_NEZVI|nr:unnamed protein product [Nezara viridula]
MSVLNKVNVISSIGYDCKIFQKLSNERQESIAGVFSTYAHSWVTSGPDLFVVNNSDGVLQSYWTFGENLQDDLEITCAVELPLEGCAIPLLILGISSENVNLICFFNPNTRKILRTIDIIYPVRTLCVIEDGTNEVYPLNDTLTPTEGLIAVGCAEGTVLLIDLCRSILCKAVNGDFRFYSTEENPCEVVYVGINSVTSGGLSQKIVESRKKKNCVSVILTDPSDDGVTALLYSIESAVLFVGTSSGSFHLWNMSSLSCLFKSPGTNRAIISLSLLEPCDDPRHSLYLWICFEEYAQVAMYCISFSSKFFVHGYGVYYQNFESAGLVYRFTLGMEVDVIAKRPICSQAVAKLVPKNLVRCISLPEAEGTHLRLFITAYEIVDKGQISIRAVIFDLNQWYRDQMPEEGVSACLDSIDLDSKSLWHLQLDPSSLTLYQCVRPQEQHFHPTAFDFQVWCIEEEGIRCLEKLGLQTQWLRNMSRMGSKALIEPSHIFLGALAAGLLPSFIDPPDPEANNEVEERSYVLTICLENRIIMVIEDCVKDWNSGGYSVKGCTIQFLLDWLWNLHKTYKANGNKICIPLFDQSGMKFDVSEKRSLQHCKSLLNTVQSVYTNIVNRYKNNIIISGVEEKLTAMSLVRLYFDCCLKLISVNLLPEPNDLGRPSDSVVYHFDDINIYAINRRKQGPFLGDSLLGRTDAERQWVEEGGTGLYPPPSIQSVLRFCLHPSPSIVNKMSLMLYLFMDIVNSYTPVRSQPVLDRIKNFQHLMRIPEVQYKIVAGCWYFDHSMFDEGVDLLFDPRVLCVDLSEDQHRGILHLLASERQEKLALQYLRLKSPTLNLVHDLRIELNLLLSNGLVNEAFLFQRKHPEMREALLIEFFEGCIERKQLGQVFGLNLDFKEESTLMKYLKSSGLKEKGDLQVLLLLSKAKYTEAMFLNDKLNSSINGPKSRIETDTRDMIVRGITGSLNSISRHMANEMKTYRPPPAGCHPRPLSSLIKVRNGPDGPLCQTDSKVLLSAVAKSTRHLSDFVNSFDSGHRRKREEKDTDVEFENEPARKRLKLWDTARDVNKVPSLSGKWLTSPCKPSASQKRDVMELVGTPLVKKRGKRFSPQSRPSSILKGKTPEKNFIAEDFGETPKKSIRFALPENEIQISARKPLRENEATSPNKNTKVTVHCEEESATLSTEESSKSRGLGKPSARKPLHGSDGLNNSVAGRDSSVIETIKDRLRSSAKKKVLEDGVNWHEVAEASKPRVLFTQGVSKINSVTKLDKTPSSTPMSQALLDITVTSAEKKYLDSPSRGEETSPVTEALFNTTLLPKVLFSSVNNEKEIKERSPEAEEASVHAAFLERYKKLRNKNVKFNNVVMTPEEEKYRDGARFEEEETFNLICTKKTVVQFKSSNTSSSTNIVVDKDIPPLKESVFNENVLKEDNDKLDDPLIEPTKKLELITDKEELNTESLLEEEELQPNIIQTESLLAESENILVNDDLYQDIENSLHGNDPLLKDDVSSYKDEDEIVQENQEKETEWSSLKLIGVEGNCSTEEPIVNCHDVFDDENMKETQMSCDIISNNKTNLNESKPIEVLSSSESSSENEKQKNDDDETLEKEAEVPCDEPCNVTKASSVKEKSKEESSISTKDCEEIIDIASDDDDEDKQSYDESLTEEETEGISGESSEEIEEEEIEGEEEEISEKEENGSDHEGSLPEGSSISSRGDDVENSNENIPVNCRRSKSPEKKIEKNENVDSKKEPTGETPIVLVLSDDSGDENSKKKKKGSNKKDIVENEELKTKPSSQGEKHYEDVSDLEVFGLKNDKSNNEEGDNSEDDMWVGLDDKESTVKKNKKKSKHNDKDKNFDLQNPENSQRSMLQCSFDSHQKGGKGFKSDNSKPLHSSRISRRKSSNRSDINKDNVEHNALSNSKLDTAKEQLKSERPVLEEDASCDMPSLVSNPLSDMLSLEEEIEGSSSVNIPVEKLVSENQPVADSFLVEDPQGVSSSVERSMAGAISEEEMVDKESEPVSSLPLIVESSSLENEDSSNDKIVDNVEENLDLREDFQSIEQNWTQQIEEEMKQDNLILKIESDNNDSDNIGSTQLFNVDGIEIISEELTDSKSIDKSEYEESKSSEIVSSVQSLEVEHTQNNILMPEELNNLSKSTKMDGKDISIKDTTNHYLGGNDNDALEKDDISHLVNSESVLSEMEKKCEDDNLVIAAGTHTENVSNNKEFKSTKDVTNKTSLEVLEVSTETFKNESIIILKESDKDEQSKIMSFHDTKKLSDHGDSNVSHLNANVDDQQTSKEDHQISISGDNKLSATLLLSSQENLTKYSDDIFKTDKEKQICVEAPSTNMSSENIVKDISSKVHHSLCKLEESTSNKNENLSPEKNTSLFINEKSKLPGNNLSETNLISVEAKPNKLSENIGESSTKDRSNSTLKVNKNDSVINVSMTPASKSKILIEMEISEHEEAQRNCTLTVRTEENDSEQVTDVKKMFEKDYSKVDNDDKDNMVVVGDKITSSQDKIIKSGGQVHEVTSEFEVESTKHSHTLEHGEETTKVNALDRVNEQLDDKDGGNRSAVGDMEVMDNIDKVSDRVESNNFDTSSHPSCEVIDVGVPSSSRENVERSKIEYLMPSEEDNHVRNTIDDKDLADSKVIKDNVINQFSHSLSSCSDNLCQLNVVKEDNFEPHVEINNSANVIPGSDGVSKNIENVSKIQHVCERNISEDQKVIKENVSLCVDKDEDPDVEPLDCQLNNAKIDVYNDASTSDALDPLKKETNYEVQNIKSAENNSKIFSDKTSIEKSFFFGKEDIETYIRSTKATFQIGGRLSLPEEDEPVDPMEVAMIEDEEKMLMQSSPTDPDIDLSLRLSPEPFKKPIKVDQGIVTDNSYLQRRARKLKKSGKQLLADQSCDKKLENKAIVNSDHIGNILNVEKESKCISTQTSDVVLDEIDLSESEEELIDYIKLPGPSQKSAELKMKVCRKKRQSSEPPLAHKEDLKRKTSICPQDVKGILKNKDLTEKFPEEFKTQSKADHLSVRRSRRLSECITERNEVLKNQCEKDHIKTRRRSRGYSEEPDFYRISSYKDKESASGYISSENEKEATEKGNIPRQRMSRRHSEEPEMRSVINKNLEKGRVPGASANIDDEYSSKRRSKRFSEEPDNANKYSDDKRRNSKNPDYSDDDFKHSEEPEIRGILKKSSKGSRKASLSCEMINELKHKESDSRRDTRKLRSQSEDPELPEIPKKKYRQSRRSSCTHETPVDAHFQVDDIPDDHRKNHRYSEDNEIQGILKKRSFNKSRSSLLPDVNNEIKKSHKIDQSEESRELRKHSEGEIQGILKKKECRSSDYETAKLKLLADDFPEKNRRSRRHSEEPEMLKPLKKRERRGSQSSDIDNELNLKEGLRRIRRHSEEPEVRGILKRRSSISRKSLKTTDIDSDINLKFEDESRKSKGQSDESEVKGILKKSKNSRRRNSSAGETDKSLQRLERDSSHHKSRHLLDDGLLKDGKKRSNISRSTDSINCAKIQDDEFDEERLSNKNTLKNQTCLYVFSTSDKNDGNSNSDDIVKMVTDDDEPKKESKHKIHSRLQMEDNDDSEDTQVRVDNKEVDSFNSENKRSRRSILLGEERQSVKEESPAKVRRRSSSSSAIAKEEPVDTIAQPEGEIRNTRMFLRRTPDRKEVNTKIMEERKKKVEPENLKFVPKRLDYSDDESPEKKKSRSLIDFPIKRNSRLPRPALEDIREEDEDLLKKNKKSLDDFHLEEMKKKASKKSSVSKLVIGDSDVDSDVSTPELWKKDLTKEKRLTRTQQKVFLMNQQLTSVSEVESPSTSSSPRRSIRKKADVIDSPVKTPTRSSLRLQKKPPSETD